MAAASSEIQATLRTLQDASSPDTKAQALTSLRRSHLNDQQVIKALNNKDFCELCNAIINVSITECVSDKLHIEACRTLDIILPESKNKEFDFFQSIIQINRKKRLKQLLSLSIFKDETVAIIASKLSILNFLSDCMESVQLRTMNWLLPENADNEALLRNIDSRTLSENDEFEEKVVERSLQLLCRLCGFYSFGLTVQQFDTFIMDKVMMLAYMGHSRQRNSALTVLQKAAKNDLGTRVRSFHKEIWEKYKAILQNVYCKRMTLLVNTCNMDWAPQWETSIVLIGTDLHKGSALVNSLLKVEEHAFKSADQNRRQAFLSWKVLIDNFALDQRELATPRRIKLLCVPLNAKNSRNELMVLTKMEVWWHLISRVYPSLAECTDTVLVSFLNLCFGPFGDKPLFLQTNDNTVALGKKFVKTQIFSINALAQLIVSKEDQFKIHSLIDDNNLPNPVNNSVFEKIYKIFIYCFGESLIILGLLPDKCIENRLVMCKIIWVNLIQRIEEYDKMKVPMYKEVLNVISELIRNQFHKIPLIKDFLLHIFSKNYNTIASNAQLTENILLDLVDTFLQTDNFPCFTKDHYQAIESVLFHLIKPSNADVYYPETLELMQKILNIVDEARKTKSNMSAACEIWCILAKIAKKIIEDSQNINEGTLIEHNFKTIESIVAFPFASLITDDLTLLKTMAESWCNLYEQFDLQTALIVTVKPNEILEKTSKMIMSSLETNKNCCDFAAVCINRLLGVVNYENLSRDKVPEFVHLLKNLTLQCLCSKSFATDKVLKALSSFLLCVFGHNSEKTALYLKNVEPAVKLMFTKLDDSNLESEISEVWSTIANLFKKLQQSLNYDLLSCYRSTIIAAASKQITSSAACSILDMKESVDEKSKKLLEDIIKELEKTSILKNVDISELKEKSKKKITSIGSFLNRKIMSPSRSTPIAQNGKENMGKTKVINFEPDSQDFVVINTDVKLDVNRLTDHQKEKLKKRRDDIPAMYNELSVSNSQDSQQLQRWFDSKSEKLITGQKKEITLNNNETAKTASSSALHFNNIAQAVSSEQEKKLEKLTTSLGTAALPSFAVPPRQEDEAEAPTIGDSPKSNKEAEPAPNVAKKLDFEAREEEDDEQTSPSIIEPVKMRRKNPAEENNGPGTGQEKGVYHSRRSLQPDRESLKKSNSTEQLNTRSRKRRNSDSNSEGMLNIERAKKPRISESLEVCNSCDSNEDNKSSASSDSESKKSALSKRTINEMTRLKIDMRFEAVPNRRSISKTSDALAGDKKTTASKDEKSKEDKAAATPVKLKEDKIASPAKLKETKAAATPSKSETYNQQQQKLQSTVITRRSLKAFTTDYVPVVEKVTRVSKVDSGNKRQSENLETPVNKCTARKSLPGKVESTIFKKKNEAQMQDTTEVDIEDVTTQLESSEKTEQNSAKSSTSDDDESDISEVKSSQDSDIVESSQEPSLSAKFDKPECFIKIKKVELLQNPIVSEQVSEKSEKAIDVDEKLIPETPADLEDKSISIIPATIELEKIPYAEPKKIENTAKPIVTGNHSSSPKSSHPRSFKSKGFPLGGRAAQMLGLVTKQSIAEKFGVSELSKTDVHLTDEVTIVPVKKDKPVKECERLASPISSRQEKMFNNMNNMNNLKQLPERCSSPSITMFSNLKNDGERISPKLERHQQEKESEVSADKELSQNEMSDASDDSPKKNELPMLEWSNANPPSLTASPSVSILKRMQEYDIDTPNRKKRVSFADPPVSREMGYEIMTETSSPPRLEKLPTARSPVSRKETRRQRRRLVERESDTTNSIDDKLANNEIIDGVINISSEVSVSVGPKVKLVTVLSKIDVDEPKIADAQANEISHTQDVDMFEDTSVPTNDATVPKTSTQNDKNNSSPKLESINLSNILQKSNSNRNSSLEDTVDVNNLSSSIESTHSFTDRATSSGSMANRNQTDTLPVTDSVFSNPALTQESQSIVQLNKPEILDSTLPVYPSLTSCNDSIDSISAELVDPMFVDNLAKHFSMKSIRSVGDLAQLTEREINRLPIVGPKVANVKKILSRFEEKLVVATPEKKTKTPSGVSSSTPLRNQRREKIKSDNDSFDELVKCSSSDLDSLMNECKKPSKRFFADISMQTSPVKRLKKEDEKACAELMAQCDDDFLLNQFVKRFDFEKALQGYKIGSSELLGVLAKNLSQEGVDGRIPDTADLRVLLDRVPSDTLIDQVKARNELKSVGDLVNIVLDKAVAEKVDSCEVIDLCADLLKSKICKVHRK